MRGPVRAADVGVTAAVVLASQIEISTIADHVTGSLWAVRMAAAVVCAGILLVRSWPLGAVLVASAGMTGLVLAGEAPIAVPFLVLPRRSGSSRSRSPTRSSTRPCGRSTSGWTRTR